jgi:E3 ubiquitin-protein ligase UBR7
MYQCLGLKHESEGGCGEDWWHPECLLGLPRDWYQSLEKNTTEGTTKASSEVAENETVNEDDEQEDDDPTPPGFPDEDDFETLICYKCTNSSPWIKQYANADGFMFRTYGATEVKLESEDKTEPPLQAGASTLESRITGVPLSKKRKADDEDLIDEISTPKRQKSESEPEGEAKTDVQTANACLKLGLPAPPTGSISLFARDKDFRTAFCRCPDCYPFLSQFPQLLEEEENYEPPISEDGDAAEGGGSAGTGSLLDRGEAALSNMDRVRAIGKFQDLRLLLCIDSLTL